jgi:hypothetical protein
MDGTVDFPAGQADLIFHRGIVRFSEIFINGISQVPLVIQKKVMKGPKMFFPDAERQGVPFKEIIAL